MSEAKLIARFMKCGLWGFIQGTTNIHKAAIESKEFEEYESKGYVLANPFTVWQELMPVVQKIQYEHKREFKWYQYYDDETLEFTGEYWCQVLPKPDYHAMSHAIVDENGSSELDVVYKAVVSYILWYQKQQENGDTQ